MPYQRLTEAEIDELLKERQPRTLAERLMRVSPDFFLALGFFSLGLAANLFADAIKAGTVLGVWGVIFGFGGAVCLRFASLTRQLSSVVREAYEERQAIRVADRLVDALRSDAS